MSGGHDAEVIVVGLGIHGVSTVASLARRGVSVIGVDRFEPGHTRGSSHGRTRMIRRAYPNPVWNDLVARTWDAWGDLEADSGQRLIHTTGGLYAHAGEAQLQGPQCRLVTDPDELHARMPGFAVPAGHRAVWDPSAGVIEAERALTAQRTIASAAGADLRFGVTVTGWESTTDGVRVRTADGDLRARRLVIAGGAWMGALVPALAPLLEVWRILTLTVRPGQPVAAPPSLGAFSIDRPDGLMFGIPDVDGNGLKIGVDAGALWNPDEPVAAPTDAEIDALRALMAAAVPGVDTAPIEAAACLYTMTTDKRFIIGALADAPHVIVASACSGHGFKFGPAIGEALADLAQDRTRADLDFISTARRGL